MTAKPQFDMPEVERVPVFECYIRTKFVGEGGYETPEQDVADWEATPSREAAEYVEALKVVIEQYHEDDEVIHRVWVETRIRR